MATAFSEQEKQMIRAKLMEEARKCISTIGMRKTTVDQLAYGADISKGAFYKFYESKEMLFFEVLESLHTEIYDAAFSILDSRRDLPESERAALAFLTACKVMEENSMMDFFENDLSYLLRKIPQDVLEKYYSSDDAHIRELFTRGDLHLKVPVETASAAIRAIFLTLQHQTELGSSFHAVIELLVRGVCRELLS